VGPSDDGIDHSIDGGDGQHDGRDSGTPARGPIPITGQTALTKQQLGTFLNDLGKLMVVETGKCAVHTDSLVQAAHSTNPERFNAIEGKLDTLIEKMNATWMENTALCEAYCASHEETALLKAAIEAVTTKLHDTIAISIPPSPEIMATTSTAMEEMTMQFSVIQHDIQDVLEAVRNPPGKRKHASSN
jgi:hypothetical protein